MSEDPPKDKRVSLAQDAAVFYAILVFGAIALMIILSVIDPPSPCCIRP